MNKEDFLNTKWDVRDWTKGQKEHFFHKAMCAGCSPVGGSVNDYTGYNAGLFVIDERGIMLAYDRCCSEFAMQACRFCEFSDAFPETEQVQADTATPTASDLLSQGTEILNQRGAEYEKNDNQERSFDSVAAAFNAITGKDLTAAEVALVLQCVKDVRQWSQDRLHEDSVIDGINYAALKGELLHKQYGESK